MSYTYNILYPAENLVIKLFLVWFQAVFKVFFSVSCLKSHFFFKYNCVYLGAAQFFWSQCQNGFHSTNCSHRSNPTQPGRGGNLMTVETSFNLMTSSTSSFHSALSMLDKGSLQSETKSGHFVYHNPTLGYKSKFWNLSYWFKMRHKWHKCKDFSSRHVFGSRFQTRRENW